MKKVVIVGATSGLGLGLAMMYLKNGAKIGVAGRRVERLEELRKIAPDRVSIAKIDVCDIDSGESLLKLIEEVGGMDVYINASGYGTRNPNMAMDIELATLEVNGLGFYRMVITAFNYFKSVGGGHIAIISSIAGTRGLGPAAAYSATKMMQSAYVQALSQQSNYDKLNITFSDIRPGFVATEFISGGTYPMVMKPEPVIKAMYKAIERKKRINIIDWKFKILVFIWRIIPRCLYEKLPLST